MSEPGDKAQAKERKTGDRAQRFEWAIYACAVLAGVGYVGPYLGRITGYYEGLFSLAFVLCAVGLVQLYRAIAAGKSGETNGGE